MSGLVVDLVYTLILGVLVFYFFGGGGDGRASM